MFDKLFDELIYEDKLGETWRLELAPNHSKYSISSRKSGSEKWAKSIARKLTEKEKEDFKLIGIYSEVKPTKTYCGWLYISLYR